MQNIIFNKNTKTFKLNILLPKPKIASEKEEFKICVISSARGNASKRLVEINLLFCFCIFDCYCHFFMKELSTFLYQRDFSLWTPIASGILTRITEIKLPFQICSLVSLVYCIFDSVLLLDLCFLVVLEICLAAWAYQSKKVGFFYPKMTVILYSFRIWHLRSNMIYVFHLWQVPLLV